jgi:hypothetical protein
MERVSFADGPMSYWMDVTEELPEYPIPASKQLLGPTEKAAQQRSLKLPKQFSDI